MQAKPCESNGNPKLPSPSKLRLPENQAYPKTGIDVLEDDVLCKATGSSEFTLSKVEKLKPRARARSEGMNSKKPVSKTGMASPMRALAPNTNRKAPDQVAHLRGSRTSA